MNRADRIAMISVGGLISLTGIAINILSVRHVHQSAKLLRSIDPVKDQPKMLPIGW